MIFSTLPKYRGPYQVGCIDVEYKTSRNSILKLFYPIKTSAANSNNFASFFPYPSYNYFMGKLISNHLLSKLIQIRLCFLHQTKLLYIFCFGIFPE
jgi:hypothetical protein